MKASSKYKTSQSRKSGKKATATKSAQTKAYPRVAIKKVATILNKKGYPTVGEILIGEEAFKVIMNREAVDLQRLFREHKKSGGLAKKPTKLSSQGDFKAKVVKRGVVLKSLSPNAGLMKFELVVDEDKRLLVRK